MKKVFLTVITAFAVIFNGGDADATEAAVKEATGQDTAEGFEFEGGDNSVNVTVADGSKVNVPNGSDSAIMYNYTTKTWAVVSASDYAAGGYTETDPNAQAAAEGVQARAGA